MKINGYLNNYNQQKYYNGYFSYAPVFRANPSQGKLLTGGILNYAAQKGLESIHNNLTQIKDLFLLLANYPAKSIAIKEGYHGLIQKNRNQGLSFSLPDNRGSIIMRQLRAEPDIIRFIVEDKGEVKNIYTKGFNRVIANINPKNPNNLPRRYRYMDDEEINASNVEEYIKITQKELKSYSDYLAQFHDPAKRKQVPVARKTVNGVSDNILTPKENISKINKLMRKSSEEFPEDFKINKAPDGMILSFSFNADDGALVKVAKAANKNYGSSVLYIKFSRQYEDGRRTSMAVDLTTYKFLKLKDDGRPLIRNDVLHEYSEEEVKRRNMTSKLSDYVNEVYKHFEKNEKLKASETVIPDVEVVKPELPVAEPKKKSRSPKETDSQIIPKVTKSENTSSVSVTEPDDANFEKMKNLTIEKAKKDAQTLADIYFKTLTEAFNELITKKISDFKVNIEKIFVKE